MSSHTEGRLSFSFNQAVQVLKYDDVDGWFDQNFKKAQGRKAVDFLLYNKKQSKHWWLEVKDFAQDPKNAYRLGVANTSSVSGRDKMKPVVWDEAITKFADTVLGLWVARSDPAKPLQPFDRVVTGDALEVVLVITWFFRGKTPNHVDKERKRLCARLQTKINQPLNRYGVTQIKGRVLLVDAGSGLWR